jgi:hypothetical protein
MKDDLRRLFSRESRQDTVLVIRGTGLNFWHYFPLLRQFTLEDLREFRGIYAVSGGAAAIWFYCLAQEQLLMVDGTAYDRLLRKIMNRYRLFPRMWKYLRNQYTYFAEDNLTLIKHMVAPEAMTQTLSQLPLRNLVIVAHDEQQGRQLLLRPDTHPEFGMAEVISRIGTRSAVGGKKLCARTEYCGLYIADFELATHDVKKQLHQHLISEQADMAIYQINIFRNGARGDIRYVKICRDRFPGLGQLQDFVLLYLGIPNSRYQAAITAELPSINDKSLRGPPPGSSMRTRD